MRIKPTDKTSQFRSRLRRWQTRWNDSNFASRSVGLSTPADAALAMMIQCSNVGWAIAFVDAKTASANNRAMRAWNGWYHVNGNTYGTWLRGDPRG